MASRSPTRRCWRASAAEELTELLRGYGYEPHFVEGDDPDARASGACWHARQDPGRRFVTIQSVARAPRDGRKAGAPALADDRVSHAQRLDGAEIRRWQAGRRHLARASGADRGFQESRAFEAARRLDAELPAAANCSTNGANSARSSPRLRRPVIAAWAPTPMPMAECAAAFIDAPLPRSRRRSEARRHPGGSHTRPRRLPARCHEAQSRQTEFSPVWP